MQLLCMTHLVGAPCATLSLLHDLQKPISQPPNAPHRCSMTRSELNETWRGCSVQHVLLLSCDRVSWLRCRWGTCERPCGSSASCVCMVLTGHALAQVRMEDLWKAMRQQEDKRAQQPGLLSKLRKNMSSSGR